MTDNQVNTYTHTGWIDGIYPMPNLKTEWKELN